MAARPNIELSGRLNFYERRRGSSPPPGIEFVFYGILAGFILGACAIAYYIARLLKKLLKISLGLVEISIVAVLFLLSFWASSLVLSGSFSGLRCYYDKKGDSQ